MQHLVYKNMPKYTVRKCFCAYENNFHILTLNSFKGFFYFLGSDNHLRFFKLSFYSLMLTLCKLLDIHSNRNNWTI